MTRDSNADPELALSRRLFPLSNCPSLPEQILDLSFLREQLDTQYSRAYSSLIPAPSLLTSHED